MIVPQYWSEAKVHTESDGRKLTIKRFGWSDISEADAKLKAESRLQDALTVLKETGRVRHVDHKVAYNGAEGVPIREEVIERHDDIVISRNSYGALCLNTPDVMFADIDFNHHAPSKLQYFIFIILSVLSLSTWFFTQSLLAAISVALFSLHFSTVN